MAESVDPEGWACPLPLRDYDRIVMGHGGGGTLTAELIDHLFRPALGGVADAELLDAAILDEQAGKLAFSTDSYVVRPLFYPGGSIGDLAVNGTVNDLAMVGAQPLALSAGFILEEGLALATLGRVAEEMGAAASRAGVPVEAGDTKVVGVGQADGMYITTAGIGVIPDGVDIRPRRAAPGDVVIISGPIGLHGVAVMSRREGLEFGTEIRSDSAPLNGLVSDMIGECSDIHVLRDATRGGIAAVFCEVAEAAGVGIAYDDSALPIPAEVAAACAILGLDAVAIANEGVLVAVVPPEHVDNAMNALHGHEHGRHACVVGEVTEDHPGVVVARTPLGATRIVDRPLGEQLPRIC